MLIDHKREMINQFEELSRLHRKGLEKAETLLEEDLELFNRFLEDNKNNSRNAIKRAEDETKAKQEKVNEIKTLIEHRADLMTKNAQKIENLDDLLKYKRFLDKITPREFFENQQARKKLKQARKQKQAEDHQESESLFPPSPIRPEAQVAHGELPPEHQCRDRLDPRRERRGN